MKKIQITLLFAIFFYTSCDFPKDYFSPEPDCFNKVSYVLDHKDQMRLLPLLEKSKPQDYRYFFKSFEEVNSQVYMVTNFRNEEVCFDMRILVDKWDKLAGMKRANGYSYPKELYDLLWEITYLDGKKTVRYLDMHDIID